MSDSNDMALGYAMGQDSNGNNNGGFFGNDGIWAIIIFAMIFGWGNGGFGGFGGGGGGGGGGVGSEVQRGFDHSSVVTKLDGITQGICDAAYSVNSAVTNGFSAAELSRAQQQAALMQQLFAMQMQDQSCCCETREAIQGVRYDMATQACDIRNTIQGTARDIIDNANANYRGLMDFLVAEKMSSKDATIAQLQNQLSQSQQNGVIRAAIDAATAEILRRIGNGCGNSCGNSCGC